MRPSPLPLPPHPSRRQPLQRKQSSRWQRSLRGCCRPWAIYLLPRRPLHQLLRKLQRLPLQASAARRLSTSLCLQLAAQAVRLLLRSAPQLLVQLPRLLHPCLAAPAQPQARLLLASAPPRSAPPCLGRQPAVRRRSASHLLPPQPRASWAVAFHHLGKAQLPAHLPLGWHQPRLLPSQLLHLLQRPLWQHQLRHQQPLPQVSGSLPALGRLDWGPAALLPPRMLEPRRLARGLNLAPRPTCLAAQPLLAHRHPRPPCLGRPVRPQRHPLAVRQRLVPLPPPEGGYLRSPPPQPPRQRRRCLGSSAPPPTPLAVRRRSARPPPLEPACLGAPALPRPHPRPQGLGRPPVVPLVAALASRQRRPRHWALQPPLE